jgi:hypothetical protein
MLKVLRKELKYEISFEKYLEIKPQLEAVSVYDIHSGPAGYTVRSLYFDSYNNGDLFDNLHGIYQKSKIRLRIYSYRDTDVKLEYKCKEGTDGKKYSLIISREDAESMINGNYAFLLKSENPMARAIYTRLMSGAYTPRNMVEYKRIAFKYSVSNVRITFDTNVYGKETPYGFFNEYPGLYPIITPDRGVLEIKYNDFLPGPFKKIIKSIDTMQIAYSKYGQSRLFFN